MHRRKRLHCPRRCARRRGKRITFRELAEVTEYSRAIGRHRVPTDGGELAIGLGRPIRKRLLPLQGPPVLSNCVAYHDEEARGRLLIQQLKPGRFRKAAIRHCRQNAQVMRWRRIAFADDTEPRTDMPISYAAAIESARQVAAEAQSATAEPIPLPDESLASSSSRRPGFLRHRGSAGASRVVCRKRPLNSAEIRRVHKVVRLLRDTASSTCPAPALQVPLPETPPSESEDVEICINM